MVQKKVYDNSKNYTCQVIKLPAKIVVKGLDNLVEVNFQGNSCLTSKDADVNDLYLFFPAECKLSKEFLGWNNLYRHSEMNSDTTKKGFFEDNGRVRAVKFRGVVSTGFIIPASSLMFASDGWMDLVVGDEFNEIDGVMICEKYVKQTNVAKDGKPKKARIIDSIVDSRFAPEHPDTTHLLKNLHKLSLRDYISVTYKLHGTSARYYNTLVKRKLSLLEKLVRFLGGQVIEEVYDYVSASRRVVKGVGFETLANKNHYFETGDLWSEVGKNHFKDKLLQGEAVYCEIVGKTYGGESIQPCYTYGFDRPKVFIYRISNINPEGVEVDLSYLQMKERAKQLGIDVCPELYYGTLAQFIYEYTGAAVTDDREKDVVLTDLFQSTLLERPSILDKNVVEEGFCIRKDTYGKPDIFKIKAKAFLLHEGAQHDKQVVDIEEQQVS